jgi:hypothetical protein
MAKRRRKTKTHLRGVVRRLQMVGIDGCDPLLTYIVLSLNFSPDRQRKPGRPRLQHPSPLWFEVERYRLELAVWLAKSVKLWNQIQQVVYVRENPTNCEISLPCVDLWVSVICSCFPKRVQKIQRVPAEERNQLEISIFESHERLVGLQYPFGWINSHGRRRIQHGSPARLEQLWIGRKACQVASQCVPRALSTHPRSDYAPFAGSSNCLATLQWRNADDRVETLPHFNPTCGSV